MPPHAPMPPPVRLTLGRAWRPAGAALHPVAGGTDQARKRGDRSMASTWACTTRWMPEALKMAVICSLVAPVAVS